MEPQNPEARPDLADWMTAKEVADWLGVTPRVLAANRIPHAKVGERRFYHKSKVAAWLEKRMEG